MKKKTKIILIVLAAVLVVAGIYGRTIAVNYVFHSEYKKVIRQSEFEKATTFQEIEDGEDSVRGMVLAAKNENFKLYTNTETTEVALYDRKSSKIYYTNPVDKDADSIASGVTKDELYSQFTLEYYNSSRKLVQMNNYTRSIESGQFTLESINNGIRITYTLGDMTSETDIVPTVITEERLESFLHKVSEKDAKMVQSKYQKSSTEEGVLELFESAKKPLIIKKMVKILKSAGYTEEEYLLDTANAGGIEPESITIPLEYRLTDDGLNASIVTKEISETGGAKLYDIQLLQYFMASGIEDDGYIMVPNGSGSLINFNNGKDKYNYSQYVYDIDPTVEGYTVIENTSSVRMPVFGIKYEDGALFAVIKDGDALARIDAGTSGYKTEYNTVYPTFYLRGYELLKMFGVSGSQSDLPVVEKNIYDTTISVDYAVLERENASYSGMASYYRNRLINEGTLTETLSSDSDTLPFYLDILGSVDKQKDVAGIQYMDIYKMTTFDQASDIVTNFSELGISNIRMNYLGWFNGGYYHDVADKIKNVSELGSKKNIKELEAQLKATGGGLFGNVAFNRVSFTSKRYSLGLETSKYYTGMAVVLGEVNPIALRIGTNVKYQETKYAVLSPKFLDIYTGKFVKAFQQYGMSGIALRDLGSVLASDKKRTEPINRQQAEDIVKASFETLEARGKKLMVSGGNAYSLGYTTDIVDAPLGDSDFYLIDEEIPFYEMVLHGYINYTGSALNLIQSTDRKDLVLDLIETGSAPRYIISWQDSSNIKYTGLNKMCSVKYSLWNEEAGKVYKEVSDALSDVLNQVIVSHEIINEYLRKVTYGNGVTIYINRGENDVVVDGIEVPAKGYNKGDES